MKLVTIHNIIEGKYYLELDNHPADNKILFLGTYDGQKMRGVSKVEAFDLNPPSNLVFNKRVFEHNVSWSLASIAGSLYELNEEEVLQYIVMEQL